MGTATHPVARVETEVSTVKRAHPVARVETEVSLIKRAQRGDATAFANIFYAHKPRIYSLCLRMTGNIAEAEDLTQESFLQVFRKLPTFRGDSALSTWMYRVAVNTVLMYFRKRGRPQVSLDEPSSDQVKTKTREYGSDDQRLVTSIDRLALARAIRELPDGYRTIFLLHEVDGYEHREIARLLKCSVGNSKSQLHKARVRMREILCYRPESAMDGKSDCRTITARPRPVLHKSPLHKSPVSIVARASWNASKRPRKARPEKTVFVGALAASRDVGIEIAA